MTTVSDDLTLIRTRLHDDGDIWTDAELVRYYNDGYREILAKSGAFNRLLPLDVPGRHSYAVSYSWESMRHTNGGTWWFPFLACYNATRQATSQWEVEHLDKVTPSASMTGLTMQWERVYVDSTDRHFYFGLPADHERVKRLEWNGRALFPAAVREFDEVDDAWMTRVGEPNWWTTGVGQVRSVEVYDIITNYIQAYQLVDATAGIPRGFSGDRAYSIDEVDSYNATNAYAYATQGDKDALVQATTALISGLGYRFTDEPEDKTLGFAVYAWELQMLNGDTVTIQTGDGEYDTQPLIFGLGLIRSMVSAERQYVPMVSEAAPYELLGTIRDWRSSDDNLMALETVVPPVDLGTTDAPVLIPGPFQKYLRYYVWSRAFGREGEGQRLDVAQHYEARFARGVALLKRYGDSASMDRVYRRESESVDRSRPPLVRLPATYERVW